ncbi:MAG: helix-turn-helix domain-containing protein [Candidatus Dormibacteria bacterium]
MTPTIRLRRLAAEMRRLRGSNEMTREEVSERTSINEATIYRLESARVRRPQKRTLMTLLDLYGVADPHRAELLELGRTGAQQGWLQPYHSELPEEYTTYIAFEAEARSVSNYESLYLPGLLQTEAYAHAVITGGLPMASESEVEQRVRARIERQHLLSEPGTLKLWAILDEAALHRQVGSQKLMRAQLTHMIKVANEPNVILQVIPYSAGAHPGMPGSFVLLDFPNPADPDVVYIDTMAGDLFLEKEPDIRRYRLLFEHLRAVASSPDQTTSMLAKLIDDD